MTTDQRLFGRKAGLTVLRSAYADESTNPDRYRELTGIDLSEMHFQFRTFNQDEEGPDNASVRIFNLSDATQQNIVLNEFTRVVLQAGYGGNYGVVFDGTVKQYYTGRLNQTDTFLDLYAADSDLGYNNAVVATTVAAGSTSQQRVQAAVAAVGDRYGLSVGRDLAGTGGVLPRGKVLFGMFRDLIREEAQSRQATWHIDGGKVNIVPLRGYLPGEAVVLTAATGLVGRAEQTVDGIRARCLLNPRLRIGGLVRIDNASINQTIGTSDNPLNVPARQWTGVPNLYANVRADGLYRIYSAEHTGDTRGTDWYTDLTCLAVDPATGLTLAKE